MAILEEGMLTEFALEAASREQTKGNIYKAVVANVEPSLQAAFLNYGGNRHGFLPLSEVHPDYYLEKVKDRSKVRIQQALQKGPGAHRPGHQGGKRQQGGLSQHLRVPARPFPGAPAEAEPTSGFPAKSKKKRSASASKNWPRSWGCPRKWGSSSAPSGEEGKTAHLAKDLSVLLKLWEDINKAAAEPAPLHPLPGPGPHYPHRPGLSLRRYQRASWWTTSRCTSSSRVSCAWCPPGRCSALKLYQDKLPHVHAAFRSEEQIERIYAERVPLKSGGGMVINPTEALVSHRRQLRALPDPVQPGGDGVEDQRGGRRGNRPAAAASGPGGPGGHRFHRHEGQKAPESGGAGPEKCPQNRQGPGHRGAHQQVRPAGALPAAPAPHRRDQRLYPLRLLPGPGPGQIRHRPGALSLLRQMSVQLGQGTFREVRALLPPEVANFLLNQKRKDLLALEEQYQVKITLIARPGLPLEEIQFEYLKPEPGEQQGSKGDTKESRRAQQVDEIRPGKVPTPLTS